MSSTARSPASTFTPAPAYARRGAAPLADASAMREERLFQHELPARAVVRDRLGGRAADDGIVDDREAPTLHDRANRVELHRHAAVAHRLGWLDERPARVAIPDEALAIRQPGRLGIARSRGRTRVGHGHDEV